MPDGGMLSVQTRQCESIRSILSHSQLVPGDYIALSVPTKAWYRA
jgi:hypothetical protein